MPLWVKQCAYIPLTMQLVDKGLRLLLRRGFFGRKLFTSPNMTIDNRNSVLMVWDPKLKFITIAQFVLRDDFQLMPWDVSSHVSEARNASDRRRHSTLRRHNDIQFITSTLWWKDEGRIRVGGVHFEILGYCHACVGGTTKLLVYAYRQYSLYFASCSGVDTKTFLPGYLLPKKTTSFFLSYIFSLNFPWKCDMVKT